MRSFLFKKNFRGYAMFLRVISSFLFFFAENIREVNLIIEQGNTSSKVAVYKNGHIEASSVYLWSLLFLRSTLLRKAFYRR